MRLAGLTVSVLVKFKVVHVLNAYWLFVCFEYDFITNIGYRKI